MAELENKKPVEKAKGEKPIVFVEGDEDRVVIEKGEYDTSLFSQQYITAFGILKQLIETSEDECYPGQGNSRIIAFCGDRGAGKTSCMMSVRYAIAHSEEEGIAAYLRNNGLKKPDLNFDILNPIDPSFFDESHNILELVLGQMYMHFKAQRAELKEQKQLKNKESEKVRLCFDDVKRSLSLMSGSSQPMFDKLEELENLSVAMSLHDRLKDLFKAYLRFMKKKRIVITIDDMDFSAKDAYRMCKYLQMYLNQPYCVVLISLKISQLVAILKEDENFKDAKEEGKRNEMSSKYVQKLIPISNRVQMVDIWALSERLFTIEKNGTQTQPERIKDGVVRMIFEKTRYLFYNTKGEVSPIIPHELRSFRQLLGMLSRMGNYVKYTNNQKVRSKCENNKQQFKTYFYTEWIRTLDEEDRAFAEGLATMEDIKSFNKMIVSYLAKKVELAGTDYDFKTIINHQDYTYNISTGDVFSVIRYLDRSTERKGLKDLLFFIKSCYSIKLYECYDEITDAQEEMFADVPDGDVFKSDPWFRKTIKLQNLVNGNYFRYDAGSYIMDDGAKQYNYDKLLLDYSFYIFMNNVASKMIACEETGEEPDKELKRDYLLAEFLIMCSSYNYYGDYTQNPDVNRKDSLPYYLEPFAGDLSSYVVFDIAAIFSNMINIKHTYSRYDTFFDFYNYSNAGEHDWTLLGRLKRDIKEVRNVKQYKSVYHAIASDSIIRNSDVLLSLTEMMESNAARTKAYRVNGVVRRYKMFLEGLFDTGMKTYRVGEDGKPYELRYYFIQTMSSLLDEVPEETLLGLLHNAFDMNDSSKTGISDDDLRIEL